MNKQIVDQLTEAWLKISDQLKVIEAVYQANPEIRLNEPHNFPDIVPDSVLLQEKGLTSCWIQDIGRYVEEWQFKISLVSEIYLDSHLYSFNFIDKPYEWYFDKAKKIMGKAFTMGHIVIIKRHGSYEVRHVNNLEHIPNLIADRSYSITEHNE